MEFCTNIDLSSHTVTVTSMATAKENFDVVSDKFSVSRISHKEFPSQNDNSNTSTSNNNV
jgi:hypothetical protein